jgi:hypothetical protein
MTRTLKLPRDETSLRDAPESQAVIPTINTTKVRVRSKIVFHVIHCFHIVDYEIRSLGNGSLLVQDDAQ